MFERVQSSFSAQAQNDRHVIRPLESSDFENLHRIEQEIEEYQFLVEPENQDARKVHAALGTRVVGEQWDPWAWSAIGILERHLASPIHWDDLVVGFDLSLVERSEIVLWAKGRMSTSEEARQLAAQDLDSTLDEVVPLLWATCKAETGKVPRHGTYRWIRSQDRWRVALLKEALKTARTTSSLGMAVQMVYDMLGCPEDMYGLWRTINLGSSSLPQSDWNVVNAYVQAIEATWNEPKMLHVS